jgi:hypothetical protein
MRNFLIYLVTISISLFCNCNSKRENCFNKGSKEIDLKPSRTKFSIPQACHLEDSAIFDNIYKDILLNYSFRSSDSSLLITVEIENNKIQEKQFDYQHLDLINREEIKNIPEAASILLIDSSKYLGSIKVAFLKYLIKQKNNDHFDVSIFFIKEDKIVRIKIFEWIGEVKDQNETKCIFSSVKFY